MIQEKDFLYRVPVKNALVTTPGRQVRNPEILVDVEGGEFMHGNILDANSTNKLINQSVKEAVDNKLIEGGYVTKDLFNAETSARAKGDEDLGAKIQAEQTRAEGKEKEISDKLAIVDGDSNTEGSFRKAIADVIAAAPEDLDTLKEIADKLADNDDLHTALNQAITDKADASALLNEVTRATGAESALQAAIDTKADAAALSNYVLTAALNKQIDTLNTAISAKQDAGNYIPYNASVADRYQTDKDLSVKNSNGATADFGPNNGIRLSMPNEDFTFDVNTTDCIKLSAENGTVYSKMSPYGFETKISDDTYTQCGTNFFLEIKDEENRINLTPAQFLGENGHTTILMDQQQILIKNIVDNTQAMLTPHQLLMKVDDSQVILNSNGINLPNGDNNHVLTSSGSTIDITEYAKKSEITAGGNVNDVQVNGVSVVENKIANIKPATKESLGVVKVGDGLNVTDGTISVDTTAIGTGNYIPYESIAADDNANYKTYVMKHNEGILFDSASGDVSIESGEIKVKSKDHRITVAPSFIWLLGPDDYDESVESLLFELDENGLRLRNGDNNHVLTSYGSTIDIREYALKSVYDKKIATLEARIAALEAKHTETTA